MRVTPAEQLLPEVLASPERRELRRVTAELLARRLPEPRVRELDEAGTFPRDVWRALADIGAHGLGVPPELGGSGGEVGDSLLVVMEVARRFPSLAADWILVGMTARLLLTAASAEQRRRFLPGLVSGERIFSWGMSEPSGGTDVLAGRTRGELHGDVWRFDGQKLWTSMADEADWLLLLCRTERPEPADPGRQGGRARMFSLVAVPLPQAGVEVRRVALSGMRSAATCEVYLDGAEAPAENLIGARGQGFHALRGALAVERLLAAGISLGIGVGAFEEMTRYAAEREAFGRPIGAFQAVQHPIADSAAELSAALCLAERVALAEEGAVGGEMGGADTTAMAAMAKLVAAETTARIVDRGMRIFAAHGLAASSVMQRYFRDARLQLFSPISNEMIRNLLGERLGLPRSY